LRLSESYVIDTSVVVAYIIEDEPSRDKAVELFEKAIKNKVKLQLVYQTLSEIF